MRKRAQIGNRRGRLFRGSLVGTNKTRERERGRRNERRAIFVKSQTARARAAARSRDEKFSISRTIIVALAAFTADARFQSRRRPVECILFTIPRRGRGRKVYRGRSEKKGGGEGTGRREIEKLPPRPARKISYFLAIVR